MFPPALNRYPFYQCCDKTVISGRLAGGRWGFVAFNPFPKEAEKMGTRVGPITNVFLAASYSLFSSGRQNSRVAKVSIKLSSEPNSENVFRLYSSSSWRTFTRSAAGMVIFQQMPC